MNKTATKTKSVFRSRRTKTGENRDGFATAIDRLRAIPLPVVDPDLQGMQTSKRKMLPQHQSGSKKTFADQSTSWGGGVVAAFALYSPCARLPAARRVELTSHRTFQSTATPRLGEDPKLASEIIDLRRFGSREIKPLLDTESREWDSKLHWNYASAARLISSGVEEKRLSGYALLTAGRISGYSFFFYEDAKGLLGNLYVQPGESRLESAQTLLEHVLETLLATPGLGRVETQLPHFSLDDLGGQFGSQGFSAFLRRFMAVPLPGPPAHPADTDPGKAEKREVLKDVEIVPWERRHDPQAARLLFEVYRNHVDAKINDHYKSLEGSTRLVENIVRHWGCGESLPGASLVGVHRPTQKIAAILAMTAVRAWTAHIPQIAVAPEFQGLGLGTAMMELSFRRLAKQGYKEVTLTVTDRNSDAVRLYERMGFETFKTFGAFVWERT